MSKSPSKSSEPGGKRVEREADDAAARNIEYWAGPLQQRAPVILDGGRVNFRCLAEQCPTPCCGPFAGIGQGLAPCFVSSFSDLYLLDEDVERITASGRGDLLELTADGYKLRLRTDLSCAAFDRGLCSIHRIRPAVCRAFPFDLNVFAGLVMIEKCPGVNAGWSEAEELEGAVTALHEVYQGWISRTVKRVTTLVASAKEQISVRESTGDQD